MPYIDPDDRVALRPASYVKARNPGDLNYQVTCLLDNYLDTHGCNYESINAVVGVLACAQHELYRRIASPYEDGKIVDNGDVYGYIPTEGK